MKKANKKKRKEICTISCLVALVLFVLILLVGIYLKSDFRKVDAKELECFSNSDCLIVRGSCCSCEEGGAPKCIAKNNLSSYVKQLESCSSDGSCMGLDCGQITCGCVDNVCVGRSA